MENQNCELPYQCQLCNISFKCESDMIVHMKCHNGEKPYSCNQCSKSFKSKSSMVDHVRFHTGEKPYICNQCDKSFISKKSLDLHIQDHTGGNPYSCNECHRSFQRKGNLKIHMRKHTEERSYNCNQCDKTYKYKSDLNNHLLNHQFPISKNFNTIRHEINAKSKGFACFICKTRFHDLITCKQHIKKHRTILKLFKGGSSSQKDSRNHSKANSLIPNSSLNDIKLPIDQISIKMELVEDGDLKQELDGYVEDFMTYSLQNMIQ